MPTLADQAQRGGLVALGAVRHTLDTAAARRNHVDGTVIHAPVLVQVFSGGARIAVAVVLAGQTLRGTVHAHVDAGELARRTDLALVVVQHALFAGQALRGVARQAVEGVGHRAVLAHLVYRDGRYGALSSAVQLGTRVARVALAAGGGAVRARVLALCTELSAGVADLLVADAHRAGGHA